MSEEVKFIRGNDRINQLAQRPGITDGVTRVRAEMAEADRTYTLGTAALRQAAELTQAELGRRYWADCLLWPLLLYWLYERDA
jgi:hypothetical protein